MSAIALRGSGNIDEISRVLEVQIPQAGLTNQLIHKIKRKIDEKSVYLLVFEKYYMRNEGRAGLTVLITEEDGMITVDAVGSGGGKGIIFRFNWGAESDFVGHVSSILVPMGFKITSNQI